MSKNKIIGVILAAGKGKRMRSSMPKVFHQVAGIPMVLLVVDALKKAGIDRIIVVGDSKESFQKILPAKREVKFVKQAKPQGTGHAVSCARKILSGFNGNILVACADMPLVKPDTIKRLVRKHLKSRSVCTLLTGLLDDPCGYGRILRDGQKNVIGITEHKDIDEEGREIAEVNSGMYCFSKKALFGVLPSLDKNNKQKELYLTDVISLLVEKNNKISVVVAKDSTEIMGVNSRRDLAVAGIVMNQRIIEEHMERGVTVVDPFTTYIDIRVKIGRDTVINPLTMIDGNVTIGNGCIVGPFAHLRDKTVLKDKAEIGNFVEVKKSTVGKYTKSKHLTYLGDTILGARVNVGAGTIVANYDGKNKFTTIIKNKAFIGSHSTLVAPVTVGENAITGAGSVVLRGRNVPKNTVVVGVPARVLKKRNIKK